MANHKWNFSALCVTLATLFMSSSEAAEMRPLMERGAFAETTAALHNLEHESYKAQAWATYFTLVGRQDLVFDIEGNLPLPRTCTGERDDNSAALSETQAAPLTDAPSDTLSDTTAIALSDTQSATLTNAEHWTRHGFEGQKVVMFNENHYHLASRVWLLSMLEDFKAQGFTHLGMEALIPGNTAPDTGFYTHEPTFAALIRHAHALGFEVFGYESTVEPPEGASPLEVREQAQAENIADVIATADKESRFIIFAGWGHIAKRPVGEEKRLWMAARFHQLTNIDPYTVDMVTCTYTANQNTTPHTAKVRLDATGQPVVEGQMSGLVDAQVHLPVSSQLSTSTGFYRQLLGTEVDIPEALLSPDEPRLVRAFKQGFDTVPYDQVLLRVGDVYPLYLAPGYSYELVSLDGSGEVQARVEKTIAK